MSQPVWEMIEVLLFAAACGGLIAVPWAIRRLALRLGWKPKPRRPWVVMIERWIYEDFDVQEAIMLTLTLVARIKRRLVGKRAH